MMPTASRENAPAESSGPIPARTTDRRPGRVHTDVAVAAVIVAASALIWAGTFTFEEVPAALAQGMGPAAFPRLILAVLIALALWLAVSSRARTDSAREPIHRMVYFTLLAGLAFAAVLVAFGVYGAILFAVLGIGRLWGERRWLLMAMIAAGLGVTTHLVFVRGFGVGLPRGLLLQWLA